MSSSNTLEEQNNDNKITDEEIDEHERNLFKMNLQDFLHYFAKLESTIIRFLKINEKEILKIQSKSDEEKNENQEKQNAIVEFLKIKNQNFNSISKFIDEIGKFIVKHLNDDSFKLDKYCESMLIYWGNLNHIIELFQECDLDSFPLFFPLYFSFLYPIDGNKFDYDHSNIWKLHIKYFRSDDYDEYNDDNEPKNIDNIKICLISFQYIQSHQLFHFSDKNNENTHKQEEEETQTLKSIQRMFSFHLPDARLWMNHLQENYLFRSFEFNNVDTFQKSAICDTITPEKITITFDKSTYMLLGLYYLQKNPDDLLSQHQNEKPNRGFHDIDIQNINHLLIPDFVNNQKMLERYQKQKQKMDADIPIEERQDDSVLDPFVQSKKLIGIIHAVFEINHQSEYEFVKCIRDICLCTQKITQAEYPNYLMMIEKEKELIKTFDQMKLEQNNTQSSSSSSSSIHLDHTGASSSNSSS